MSQRKIKNNLELSRLIQEQDQDRNAQCVYSERIVPRKQKYYENLTLKQKACMVLSHIMTQKEIARIMKISVPVVKEHLEKGRKNVARLPAGYPA